MAREKTVKNINMESSTIVGMAQNQLVQKRGEAASQMIQAFKGKRYDQFGSEITHNGRNLKGIGNYSKGDPSQQQKVIKSQAGFSAELIKEARDNKEAILNGDETRTRTTDGLGKGNHPKYDHEKVDANGNVIEGSGTQMKFYGVDKKGRYKVIEKLVNDEKWDRYDKPIDVPSEQYEKARKYAEEKAEKLREQADKLRKLGKNDLAQAKENKANKYDQAKERIRKSNVSTKEAVEARLDPKKFTAKEVLSDSHETGLEAAKGAFIIGGSISTAQNLYAVFAEEKPLERAAADVAKSTISSSAVAYGVGVSGTVIKSMMHSSSTEMVRRIGNTNAPTLIATSTVEICKSMRKYARGDLTEVELLEELGEKGTGMLASGYAASVGATAGGLFGSVVPVVGTAVGMVVGGFVGSFIGYSSSSMLYKGAMEALKEEELSLERRKVLEAICENTMYENRKYQNLLNAYAQEKFTEREELFSNILIEINDCIKSEDIDGFIGSMNKVCSEFGLKMMFNTFEEIDEFMLDENSVFKL